VGEVPTRFRNFQDLVNRLEETLRELAPGSEAVVGSGMSIRERMELLEGPASKPSYAAERLLMRARELRDAVEAGAHADLSGVIVVLGNLAKALGQDKVHKALVAALDAAGG
jgi:hypothetical protein